MSTPNSPTEQVRKKLEKLDIQLTPEEQKYKEAERSRQEYIESLHKQIKGEDAAAEKRRMMSQRGRVLNDKYSMALEQSQNAILNQSKYDYYDLAYSRAINTPHVFTHAIQYGH